MQLLGVIWNAVLTAVVVTLLAGLFVAALPPTFIAKATVKGTPDDILLIRSGDLLGGIVRDTKLDLMLLEGWIEGLTGAKRDPMTLLRAKMLVQKGQEENWIDIQIEASDAKTAANLANEIAVAYLNRAATKELSIEEKRMLMQRVEAADAKIAAFQKQHPVVLRLNQEYQLIIEGERNAQQKIDAIHKEIERYQMQIDFAEKKDHASITDGAVRSLIQRRDNLIVQGAAKAERYGAKHNNMKNHDAAIAEAKTILDEGLKDYIRRLNELILRERQKTLKHDKEVSEWQARRAQVDAQNAEMEALKLERQTAVDEFNGLTRQNQVTEFAEALPPEAHFGMTQVWILVGVFFGSFTLMVCLLVVRNRRLET